ncbi:lipoprotein-releasing ABC transporter permease subunit [Acetobacteraceae bacterium]|nr:lipoprotein-releasing ABC transporter permease subunit [Acetobacteraceae bacterium]
MFGKFERMVAWRYLRARRGDRFVSLIAIFSFLGIMLGVATLIVVMGVMNGFKADLMGRVLGLHGDLNIYAAGAAPIKDYENVVSKTEIVPSVARTTPLVEGTVLFQSGSYTTGAALEGISTKDLKNWKALSGGLVEGSWQDLEKPNSAAIGIGMARRAGLGIGSEINLLSPTGRSTPFGTMPRAIKLQVTAIFDADWNDYNSGVVMMSLSQAQNFLLLESNEVSLIQVGIDDPMHARQVGAKIKSSLENPTLHVSDWTQSANGFLNAVTVERNVMFLILSLIILVAAFNIISSLIMMVKDKGSDIAIMRSFGVSQGGILRIFIMCGAAIGTMGTAAGALLGIGFALNIEHIRHVLEMVTGTNLFNPEVYFLAQLPVKIDWGQVTEVVLLALSLALLATLYPSWRAAHTDPVEMLRREG